MESDAGMYQHIGWSLTNSGALYIDAWEPKLPLSLLELNWLELAGDRLSPPCSDLRKVQTVLERVTASRTECGVGAGRSCDQLRSISVVPREASRGVLTCLEST